VTSDVQLISVFPNPATDHITLRINSSKTQPETLVLSDLNGKQVINQQNNLKNGSQDILFPLHGLAAGTYMLSLTDADGIEATRGITVK